MSFVSIGESVDLEYYNIKCKDSNGAVEVSSRNSDDINLSEDTDNSGLYKNTWSSNTPGLYRFSFPDGDKVNICVKDSQGRMDPCYDNDDDDDVGSSASSLKANSPIIGLAAGLLTYILYN